MKLLTPFAIENPQQTLARKLLFAERLLRNPADPFSVALQILADTGEALRAAQEWPSDFVVIEHQRKLIDEQGEAAFLPGEVETARLADDMARGRVSATMEKIAALKVYSEMRGWTGKSAVVVNNQTNLTTVNRVMIVRESASDAEWQEKARRQQKRLTTEVFENVSS